MMIKGRRGNYSAQMFDYITISLSNTIAVTLHFKLTTRHHSKKYKGYLSRYLFPFFFIHNPIQQAFYSHKVLQAKQRNQKST